MSIDVAPYIVPVKPGKPVVRPIDLIKAQERLAEQRHGSGLTIKRRARAIEEAGKLLLAALLKGEITAHFETIDQSYDVEGRYWICETNWKEEKRWRPDLAMQTSELNFGDWDDLTNDDGSNAVLPLYAPFNGRRLFLEQTDLWDLAQRSRATKATNSTLRPRPSDTEAETFVKDFAAKQKKAGRRVTEAALVKAAKKEGLDFRRDQLRGAQKRHAPGKRGQHA
jgi:hypothetical protein